MEWKGIQTNQIIHAPKESESKLSKKTKKTVWVQKLCVVSGEEKNKMRYQIYVAK